MAGIQTKTHAGRLASRQSDKQRNKLQTYLFDEKTSNRAANTLVIMTFSLMTLSIIGLIATLSESQLILSVVILSVFMLSIVMVSVVAPQAVQKS